MKWFKDWVLGGHPFFHPDRVQRDNAERGWKECNDLYRELELDRNLWKARAIKAEDTTIRLLEACKTYIDEEDSPDQAWDDFLFEYAVIRHEVDEKK